MRKNLILTGMMGVGKSTIGKSLAKKLSYTLIDIDKLVEKKEGSSINLIFKRKGENYFRTVENDITLQMLKGNNSVIALGGGAFLNKTIRTRSKKLAVSFWLDLNTEELIKRLTKTKKRPLLYKKQLNQEVRKIYLERKKTYNEADYKINCNFLKPGKIADLVLELYEKSGNKI